MNFKKGDMVRVFAEVHVTYFGDKDDRKHWKDWEVVHEPEDKSVFFGGLDGHEPLDRKVLLRREIAGGRWGLVVGYTKKATGYYWPSRIRFSQDGAGDDVDPPYLEQDKRHLVVVIEPCDVGDQRYRPTFYCFEEDLRRLTKVAPYMDMVSMREE